MKSIIFLFLLNIIFCNKATAQLQCRTVQNTAVAQTQAITSPPDFDCSDFVTYYPMGNNVVTVYANFIFLEPTPGAGRFRYLNATHAQQLLDSLNYYYAHINAPTFPLPAPYTAGLLTNAKIRFILKTVSHVVNSNSYNNLNTVNYAHPDTNAITFIYGRGNDCCGLGEDVANKVRYYSSDTTTVLSISQTGDARLMLHEAGHVFGLEHTDLSPQVPLNPNGTIISGTALNDFWQEDTTQYNSCVLPYPNNTMGYNCSREYLSPKQIGRMHTTLKLGLARRAVQSYVSNLADCSTAPGGPWAYYFAGMSQVITTDPDWRGDVVIQSGVHITISTCLRMPKGSRIIVEPGAKLSVINGKISGSPCGLWRGIEVRNNYGIQGINSSGMPNAVGMVELDNAVIANAETGVLLGQRDANGLITSIGGGGIIFSKNSKYINNKIAVQFTPYFFSPSGAPGNFNNLSYFKRDTFMVDQFYDSPYPHIAAVKMEKVKDVSFLGCFFKDVKKCGSTGIQCIDASIKMKDYCTSVSGSACSGILISNTFLGFAYGIHITTLGMFDFPSLIDHTIFNQDNIFAAESVRPRSHGGIYMLNNTSSQITNCEFHTTFYDTTGTGTPVLMPYAMYLDNCSIFFIENNKFKGHSNVTLSYNTYRRAGLFINNSGPSENNIYNNEFQNFTQALWVQNMNYDPVTYKGLLMQCNDFLSNKYAIGIQNVFQGLNCVGCPPPGQLAGISPVQGILGPNGSSDYVRNNYLNPIPCGTNYSENKYYINTTDNAFAINSHASFSDVAFQPLSQVNSCGSDVNELTILSGISQQFILRINYCPNNTLPTFSNFVLNENATSTRGLISDLTTRYELMDGGNGTNLLALINNPAIGSAALKDSLVKPAFLSDKLLKAYFTRANNSIEDLGAVFEKNAPVNPRVWVSLSDKLLAIGVSAGELSGFDSLQHVDSISVKNKIEYQLTYSRNQLGLINNEKLRRFLNDSAGVNYDSIITLYKQKNEFAWGKYRIIDALVAANRFDDAGAALTALAEEEPENIHFIRLQNYIIGLKTEESALDSLQKDDEAYDYLMHVANSNNALLEGYAKSLLAEVYNYKYKEVIYSPEESNEGARVMAKSSEEASQENKKETNVINSLSVFPNPASSLLTVTLDKNISDIQLHIVNVTGVTLLSTNCAGTCQVDISSLQEGVYFVNVFQAGKFVGVKKLVVLR